MFPLQEWKPLLANSPLPPGLPNLLSHVAGGGGDEGGGDVGRGVGGSPYIETDGNKSNL
jgi:hypothetical protein